MLATDLRDLQALLRRKRIMFCYCGYVTDAVLTGVGEALKQKMAIDEADTKTMRSVFAVFVEQMQNIMRYSAEREPPDEVDDEATREALHHGLRYGVIAIGHDGGVFFVDAGNLVLKHDVERLRAWLERIRASDKASLKALYREQLRAPREEAARGAGVGLIDIALRASKPIEFDFTEVSQQHAFFSLRAEI